MASENIEDWEQPLPTPSEESEEIEDLASLEEQRQIKNFEVLQKYVELRAYRSNTPPLASTYTENLAKPKPRTLIDNSKQFPQFMEPAERGERLKRLPAKFTTITPEQLEQLIRSQKVNDSKKEDILKRKQKVYYELLTKLEHQSRTQYLNVLINKFANFLAKLATSMRIPPTLVDPYDRMQRGLFCNILLAIGIEPSYQAIDAKQGSEHETCHKLSHALLSLVIKSLDAAATRSPNASQEYNIEDDFEIDNYIKDRLMYAVEKKIKFSNRTKIMEEGEDELDNLKKVLDKCDHRINKPCQ